MFKKISLAVLGFLLAFSWVMAQSYNCGDGNQRYSLETNGSVVRYFASINEFEITKKSATKVVVEDTVKCRYGTDTLINIETVEFLDTKVTISELVTHQEKKSLFRSVFEKLLFNKVAEQISARGVDPYAEQETVSSTIETEVDTTGLSSYINTSSTGNATPIYQNSYQPQNSYSAYNSSTYTGNTGSYYINPYLNQSFQYTSPYSAQAGSGGATAVVTWPLSSVATSDLVYFEAIDSAGNHHYLGSAMGYQGSDTVVIPTVLQDQASLDVHIRVGSRVIKRVQINL